MLSVPDEEAKIAILQEYFMHSVPMKFKILIVGEMGGIGCIEVNFGDFLAHAPE